MAADEEEVAAGGVAMVMAMMMAAGDKMSLVISRSIWEKERDEIGQQCINRAKEKIFRPK